MISLCPACGSEQMVTAIALQKNRGLVACEHCSQAFKPRAHRVTPARERAFKRRQEAQRDQSQQPVEALPAEESAIPSVARDTVASNLVENSGGNTISGERDSANAAVPTRVTMQVTASDNKDSSAQAANLASAAQHLIDELGKSVSELNQQIVKRVEQAANQLAQSKSLQKRAMESAHSQAKAATMPSETEIPAREAQTLSSPNMQKVNNESTLAESASNVVPAQANREEGAMGDAIESSGAVSTTAKQQQQRLRRMRQAMAREKLLLDYEKLKVENDKLEIEKKKLELERVKLEIMRKHNMLEGKRVDPFASRGPALDGRPTVELVQGPAVEYSSTSDILPRTPTAFDHGKAEVKKREKVRLELLPNEPQRLHRKNLAAKGRTIKSK